MSRILWLVVAFGILGLAITLYLSLDDTIDVSQKQQAAYVPKVSIVTVSVKTQSGTLRTLAEIKPRWAATLQAHVGGEVIAVSKKAMAGESVVKDEILIQIEDSVYQARLAEANKSLADAQLVLLQEEQKANQALRDWKRSGLETELSELAKNKPQLEVARKTMQVAKKNITAAKKEIAYTNISAPFSGIVTERFVSIGQTVHAGDDLLRVLALDTLDITVSLSQRQWRNLAKNWQGQTAKIKDDRGNEIARAMITRGGGFLDPTTRQYKIFLEINKSENSRALAGEFVHVELPVKQVPNSLRIPESAFTREGIIWYVDDENRLRFFESEVLFYLQDQLVVLAPEDKKLKEYRVITAPLGSFLAGKEVQPVKEEG